MKYTAGQSAALRQILSQYLTANYCWWLTLRTLCIISWHSKIWGVFLRSKLTAVFFFQLNFSQPEYMYNISKILGQKWCSPPPHSFSMYIFHKCNWDFSNSYPRPKVKLHPKHNQNWWHFVFYCTIVTTFLENWYKHPEAHWLILLTQNGINILVGQVDLESLSKTIFCKIWSLIQDLDY